MRIVNSVLGDARGGRWQVVCDYSRLLLQQGHSVVMLLHRREAENLPNLPSGVETVFVGNHGHYDVLASFNARRRLARFQPQLAIAHCSRSVAVLRRALGNRTPVLGVTHSNKVRRLLPADAYVALSGSIADAFARAGTGKPCYRIPNMVAVPAGASVPEATRHTPVRIGALGRFDPVKGFDILIDALTQLARQGCVFTARLAGEGAERDRLQSQVREAGLQHCVSLPGWVDDVQGFLAATDILVVPARSDAFGLTPLQGATAGVPMVLSTATGHQDMFAENREALFAEIGDATATAARIACLMDYPDVAAALARAAFARTVSEYSETVVAARLSQLINKFE